MDFISKIPLPVSTFRNKKHLTVEEQGFSSASIGEELEFFSEFIAPNSTPQFSRTKTRQDVLNLKGNIDSLVNLQRINDIRWVNKFFEAVNAKLSQGGIFISCAETYEHRWERIHKKYPKLAADIFYGLSFIYNRVLPKLNLTKRSYFFLTKGNNRVISKAETFGRLISCGFEILGCKEINNLLYFAVRKIRKPCLDMHPSYGLLIKMKRLGKGGKIIGVYKFRIMHPYAEYLQEYIYKCNSVDKGGKFKDDFRIASWGWVLRKLWLDELPMIINFLKGDIKLVGIRPLSQQYFSLYPLEFRERRLKYKPGLIPPYYMDMPKTMEEIIASEEKYLNSYDKHPILTDVKYFFIVFYNIVFKGARSR